MSKILFTTLKKIDLIQVKKCAAISSIILGALSIIFGILAFTHAGPFAAIGTTGAGLLTGIGGLAVLGGILGLYFTLRAVKKAGAEKERGAQEIDLMKNYYSKSVVYVPRGNLKTGTIVGKLPAFENRDTLCAVYSTKDMRDFQGIPDSGITTSSGERINRHGEWERGLDGPPVNLETLARRQLR